MKRATLSFDGFGLNGPDKYRSRLATFTDAGRGMDGLGKLLEMAPMLAEALHGIEIVVASKTTLDQDDQYILEMARGALELIDRKPWKGQTT